MKIHTVFIILLLALLILGGGGIIGVINYEMRQQALLEAESKARILLDRNLATHTYFTHQLKPKLFQWSEDFREADYFEPSWMSSTYAVREMQKYFKSLNENDHYYKECAINARSPENEADAHERRFLEECNMAPDLTARSGIRDIDGEPYFVVLRRGETMERSCLRCHSTPAAAPAELVAAYGPDRSFNRYAGDVVSAVSIRIPLDKAFANANRISLILSVLMLAILFVIFGIILWFNSRYLFAPIEQIRDKSTKIAASDAHLGETIPLPHGRELRELTASFNAMSIKLRAHVDELEERVKARTAELSIKNTDLEQAVQQQKKTARLLEQSERKYRSMMESMPDPVYICGPDNTIAYMNTAMTQRVGRDAIGEKCHQAVHGQHDKCEWCLYDSIKKGKHRRQEIKSPLDQRIYNITHTPIFNSDGTISKLSIFRDMTDVRKLENELLNAKKFEAIALMSGGLAHDFNNLMSIIMGYISMVTDDAIPKSAREMLEYAETACHQAKALTRRLIILTKGAEPQKTLGSIEETVKQAIDAELNNAAAISWQLDIDEDLPAIAYDADQIKLVFSEIIANAVEAMPQGGKLEIAIERKHFPEDEDKHESSHPGGEYVSVRITDSGKGIHRDHLEKIFDPYFTTKELGAVKGMGLGLATAYAIIQKHEGFIEVESSEENAGTSINIDLPASQRTTP